MSKITRRSYKRKKIIMGAALFGAVGLVSTGFAAWVLSASTSVDQKASLNVGMISDKNMSFETPLIYKSTDTVSKDPYNKFHFEPDATDFSGRVRAEAGGQAPVLSLSVDFQLNQAQNLGHLAASIAITDKEVDPLDPAPATPNHDSWNTSVATAVSKGYIVLPAAAVNTVVLYDYNNGNPSNPGNLAFESENTIAKFTYVVEFQWGAFFNNQNPSLFFDDVDPTHKNSEDKVGGKDYTKEQVAGILVELHDLLDQAELTLTLTADPN